MNGDTMILWILISLISMHLDNNKGEAWAESKQSRPSLFQNWALDYWEPIVILHAS